MKYCKVLGIELSNDFEVHHIDLNRKNNEILNLVAIPTKLHRDYHQCELMQFPKEYLKIDLIPPTSATKPGFGYFIEYFLPAINQFAPIYAELQQWIYYRDTIIFGFHNHSGLSYSKKIV